MADLPSIAQRYNDIQVAANAPVTESLVRQGGSNDNFLLDLFGILDGETATAGVFADIINAFTLINSHQMTLVFTIPGNGLHAVGTFPTIPFIDFDFYTTSGRISQGAGRGPRDVFQHSVDGGPFTVPGGSIITPASTSNIGGQFGDATNKADDSGSVLGGSAGAPNSMNPALIDITGLNDPAQRLGQDAVLGVTGYESKMRQSAIQRSFTLSWRDGASHDVRVYTEGGTGVEVYLKYRLNAESQYLRF